MPANKDIKQKVLDEMDKVLGPKFDLETTDFSYDKSKEFRYLNMCIMEALRTEPPVIMTLSQGFDVDV